ncbi:MAG: DUF4198 domain-containing protein [Proteobacteria bacterium]|nr:MAG: DUF4198 domain-containing protein [Pseudomonadota bacterium]
MKSNIKLAFIAASALTLLAVPANAHRAWLLPSATVLSGNDLWVTVDAAISNDLFYFEHHPMRLDGLAVTAPDGSAAKTENMATGRYRSTFDLKLDQPGTYKIAVLNQGAFARYKLDGQDKRWRGPADEIATKIPTNATDVRITQSQGRIETFVTTGKPTEAVFKTTGQGLELVPVTHPNNLLAGEEAKFKLVLDGQPAAGLEVEVVPGGIRYRDQLNSIKVKTDESGTFAVKWPTPGMYWLSASVQDDKATIKEAKRRASYTATVEVLPP